MDSAERDFANGVPVDRLPDGGMVQGKVGTEDVILARRGQEFFAVGAHCTHYGGPLVEGLMVGCEVHCPLHHARFNLRTGEALRAPAFDPISCWRVERIGESLFVRERLSGTVREAMSSSNMQKPPASVGIVGGGGAGLAAADMLRRQGFDGPVTIVSEDDSPPYDRPNLSKEYLAGTALADWIPLRSPDYYTDRRIELVLKSKVIALDARQRQIRLENGKVYGFGALLLATGADPVKLPIQGASDSQLLYLRTFADSRALLEKAASAKHVVIVGASFIGLEVAASLRERGISVHVVARGHQPLDRVLGSEVGRFIRALHEAQGVVFHMGEAVTGLEAGRATLTSGGTLDADFLVLGVGVRPSVTLAEEGGLKVDRGVVVNEYLETSAPGVFAAGDVARYPDPYSGQLVRIEHWVVAELQGQVAARNMLGHREPFNAVPFFWTRQYGISVKYIGHVEKWDAVEIDGSLEAKNCAVAYKVGGRTLGVATIGRDLQCLQVEAAIETSAQKLARGGTAT